MLTEKVQLRNGQVSQRFALLFGIVLRCNRNLATRILRKGNNPVLLSDLTAVSENIDDITPLDDGPGIYILWILSQYYIGSTKHLKNRMRDHNRAMGKSKDNPFAKAKTEIPMVQWNKQAIIRFPDEVNDVGALRGLEIAIIILSNATGTSRLQHRLLSTTQLNFLVLRRSSGFHRHRLEHQRHG